MRYRSVLTALGHVDISFRSRPGWAADLEVTHWWTSGGEAAAAKVLAKSYDKLRRRQMGRRRHRRQRQHGAGPIIVSRILGGDPMGATQFNHGRDAEELVKAGLMRDLTDLATKEGWADVIRPAKLLDTCKL